MKSCKAKDSNGKPCPNKVDEGQEYCPYHLANQNTMIRNIFSVAGTVILGVVTIVLNGKFNIKK